MTTGATHIILFDGVCNLCQRSVQFVLKHDKKAIFQFGSLQGNTGQKMLKEYALGAETLNTFILIENGKVYTRSTAALRVLKIQGFPWSLGYALVILPRFIRDSVYAWIARNRYRWFGRTEECWLPSPEWSERFLDQN
jgi:predicted DCC family thiol-disulfide oxidoreductase YuxK